MTELEYCFAFVQRLSHRLDALPVYLSTAVYRRRRGHRQIYFQQTSNNGTWDMRGACAIEIIAVGSVQCKFASGQIPDKEVAMMVAGKVRGEICGHRSMPQANSSRRSSSSRMLSIDPTRLNQYSNGNCDWAQECVGSDGGCAQGRLCYAPSDRFRTAHALMD